MPPFVLALAFSIFSQIQLEVIATLVLPEDCFEATSLFAVTANSTCGGDPPTNHSQSSNCSVEEHFASFARDDDFRTWWQSIPEEEPVALTFSLDKQLEQTLSLVVAEVHLYFRNTIPTSCYLEIRERNLDFTLHMVYVLDPMLCVRQDPLCAVYIPDENNVVNLTFPASSRAKPIAEFRLILTGYNLETSYYSLVEVDIFAQVANGYFARSLDDLRVEGETGIIETTSFSVIPLSNTSLFPGFRGRGYAVLNFSDSESVLGQWIIPSFPSPSQYQFIFLYSNHAHRSRRLAVVVSQSGKENDARVTFSAGCLACATFLSSPNELTKPTNFTLTESMLTISIQLSSVDISLDAIVAIPRAFYDPQSLTDPERFSTTCMITSEQFNDSFCHQSALQLSIEFFLSTPDCSCILSQNPDCSVYGGQCECLEPFLPELSHPIGRQCELCPFYSHQTVNGCNACSCPDQFDNCNLQTGQCDGCPYLSFGNRCESCIPNSYRSDNGTCLSCECDPTGSMSCNQTSGLCICKQGIVGVSCDQCDVGYFNFSSSGCITCGCGLGSTNDTCDEAGQCNCKNGVSGTKCSNCMDGFYSLSSLGCIPCFCSNRSNECSLAWNSTSDDPQELCECPLPFTGMSCDSCVEGYYLSEETGWCEECECSGRSNRCTNGSGQCIECSNNSTGPHCEFCIQGMYDSDVTSGLLCEKCPCSTVTATNTSCTSDMTGQPHCLCKTGHNGRLCNNCSSGYFGSPPTTPCTDCSCNGNIDLTVPGSCDPEMGICLICINNSTGPECEVCESGYFGDATVQNCQLCDCELEGSHSSICNRSNGQCPCLQGVDGLRCDECQVEYWNFTAGHGCQPCDCTESANSRICNQHTGQCPCKFGIEGLDCSFCMDGYFNFTVDGCSECNCGIGAYNRSCSYDGSCNCLPGVTGVQCSQCLPFHSTLSPIGCQQCGVCESTLTSQLFSLEMAMTLIGVSYDRFQILMNTDLPGKISINSSLLALSLKKLSLLLRLEGVEAALHLLNENAVIMESLRTTKQVGEVLQSIALTLPYAVTVEQHVVSVHDMMLDVFVSAGNVDTFITCTENILAELSMFIQHNVSSLSSPDVIILDSSLGHETLSHSLNTQGIVNNLLELVIQQQNQALKLETKYNCLQNISSVVLKLSSINYSSMFLNITLNSISNAANTLVPPIASINDSVSEANRSILRSDTIIAEAQLTLVVAEADVRMLETIVGPHFEDPSGSESVDFSELISGSGMFEEEASMSFGNFTSINEGLPVLRLATTRLNGLFQHQQVKIVNAAYSQQLEHAAQLLNVTLSPVFEGNLSIRAIVHYSTILKALSGVRLLSNNTELLLQSVFMSLLEVNSSLGALSHVNNSDELLTSKILSSDLNEILTFVRSATDQEHSAATYATVLNDMVTRLTSQVYSLRRAASITLARVDKTLTQLDNQTSMIENVEVEIASALPLFLNNTADVLATLNGTQMLHTSNDLMMDAINNSASAACIAIGNRSQLLFNTTRVANTNQLELERVNSSLSLLHSRLDAAISAASMIDVALQFNGNSSLAYRIFSAPPSLESISLIFRPEEITSGELLSSLSRADENSERTILQLRNGSVLMDYGAGIISAGGGNIIANQWYHLYATRDENEAIISLTSLPKNGSTFVTNATIHDPTLNSLFDRVILLGRGSLENGYSGCLDHVVVNVKPLALLNPLERRVNNVMTCGPRPPAELPRGFESGAWLFGAGSYISISTTLPLSNIELQFRTFDQYGILLFSPDDNFEQSMIIYLYEGRIAVDFHISALDMLHLETSLTYNSGLWYEIDLSISELNITLVVNRNETLSGFSSNIANFQFTPSGQLFIGGLSQEYSDIMSGIITTSSMAGCVHDLQISGSMINLQISENVRVDFNGCPVDVARGVRFMGNGGVEFVMLEQQQLYNISFGFRTTQLASTLMYVGGLSVSIFHTRLRIDLFSDLVLVSQKSGLNDNSRHTGSIGFYSAENGSIMTLSVDNETTLTESIPGFVMFEQILVGGSSSLTSPISEIFRGCMDSVTVNGRELDFNDAQFLPNVSLYGCRPASDLPPISSLPPPPPPPIPPPPSTPFNQSVGLSGRNGSFIALQVTEEQIINSFSVVLEFLTVSSEGLLLYLQDLQGTGFDDFFALQLVSGQLIFSYNLGSGRAKIVSNGSYNDGVLHRVELWRSARVGQLIIDRGLETIYGDSPGQFSALNINSNSGYLFIGGVPLMLTDLSLLVSGQELPLPLLACIFTVVINGVYENLTSPQASTGVEQCLLTYNNVATFQRHSYLRMIDDFDVGVNFSFSVDFRTGNCSGMLLYIASSIYPDHLLVELRDGGVVLVFDNGPKVEVLEYFDGRELCDGDWHSLLVSKDGLAGLISVDGRTPQRKISSCGICQNFLATNTKDSLYVGGIPETVQPRFTVESGSFEGCLSNLNIYKDDGRPEAVIFSQAVEKENVQFDACRPN